MVCSEALQLNAPSAAYDLAIVLAYNDKLEPFEPTIRQNVQNQIPVVFCNDGRFGHSSMNILSDSRMSGIWWWSDPHRGSLPAGDVILVTEIHLDSRAVQVGVANPQPPATLLGICPLTPELSPSYSVGEELHNISKQPENSTQAPLLERLISEGNMSTAQRVCTEKLARLAAAGTASEEWWRTLGRSCTLPGLGDLRSLESRLSERCSCFADDAMLQSTIENDAILGKLARLKRECEKRIDDDASRQNSIELSSEVMFDREEETREIRRFFDSKRESVLFLSGLDDVGKSSAVKMTLNQSGKHARVWSETRPDTSPDFVLATLGKAFSVGSIGGRSNPFEHLSDDEIGNRIPRGAIVVISDADNLLDHGQWREKRTHDLLRRIAAIFRARGAKLILTASTRVDIEGLEPGTTRRMYVKGLPDEHATLLLDLHLRRVALEPSYFQADARLEIAKALGGHPGAIMLATDYVEQVGFDAVRADLKKRQGIHAEIVRRILTRLSFTERQEEILSLLQQARSALAVSVLVKTGIPDAVPAVQALVHQSVVERTKYDQVRITDLVRGFTGFRRPHDTTLQLFHKAAAEHFAQLAGNMRTPEQLGWAVESRFHAQLAGDSSLAPSIPGFVDGILGALRQLVDEHDYERAQPIVDRLLKSDPTAELFQLGAIIYVRLGKCEEALSLVKEALSRDEDRTWGVCEVGRLALHVRRADVAQECVDLVRRTGHDSAYIATLQGKILLREKGDAAAIPVFQRAVSLAEAETPQRDAWPHFYLGRALLKLGKPDDAVDVLYRGEAIAANSRRVNRKLLMAIRTQLCIGYVYAEELDGAKRILDLLTANGKPEAEVVWALALYRAASGDGAAEGSVVQNALQELDPKAAKDRYGRSQVYLYRAMIYLGIGNRERASEEFSKAHREDARNAFVLLRWTETLLDLARESALDREHQAARVCAEHAKSLADKVLEFDKTNDDARRILEVLHDEFHVS